jgi:hypothetical protein
MMLTVRTPEEISILMSDMDMGAWVLCHNERGTHNLAAKSTDNHSIKRRLCFF